MTNKCYFCGQTRDSRAINHLIGSYNRFFKAGMEADILVKCLCSSILQLRIRYWDTGVASTIWGFWQIRWTEVSWDVKPRTLVFGSSSTHERAYPCVPLEITCLLWFNLELKNVVVVGGGGVTDLIAAVVHKAPGIRWPPWVRSSSLHWMSLVLAKTWFPKAPLDNGGLFGRCT